MPLMHFKQVSFYRFTKDIDFTQESLAAALESARFQEAPADGGTASEDRGAGSSLPVRFGWSNPLPYDSESLVYEQNGCLLFSLQKAEKVLPASVVNQKLDQRVQAIEMKDARKLRRKEKQEMKEDLIAELLPRAFSKSSWSKAYIDLTKGLLVVASSSANKADEITSLLREDVGSLPILPVKPDVNPALQFTDWVKNQSQPANLAIGGACTLTSQDQQGMSIRCKGSENLNEAVLSHIEDGLLVSKLDVSWEDRMSFSLDEKFTLSGIKLLDAAIDSMPESDGDIADRFASEFHLFTSDMRVLHDDLLAALGADGADTEAQADPAKADSSTQADDAGDSNDANQAAAATADENSEETTTAEDAPW
ncbi:recombination-associated protein RdgC [Allohahella sp. A8]|uniref:recombination-associated protein RdgC n=1 Tax=Allohahella sp. A8 TaxID=3141461 RepID=UPI003A7FDCD0